MKPTHRIYVVDTSYLLELYRVPGWCDADAIPEIRKRFKRAWKQGDRLFLPLGCLLEYGNHVADIKDAHDRAKWAQLLHELVVEILDDTKQSCPFTLTEAPEIKSVELLVRNWRNKHVAAPRGSSMPRPRRKQPH